MVKSVLSVSHQGLRDWILQRVSALIIAVYSIGLVTFLVCHPGLSYAEWHELFALNGMKVASLLFLASLLTHAWLGIWTIFTDYIKCYILRCLLNVLVLLMLAACFFWGLLILWSV